PTPRARTRTAPRQSWSTPCSFAVYQPQYASFAAAPLRAQGLLVFRQTKPELFPRRRGKGEPKKLAPRISSTSFSSFHGPQNNCGFRIADCRSTGSRSRALSRDGLAAKLKSSI